jgi:hypothetical protein
MAATMEAPPWGASDLAEYEPEPLSAAEAAAIVVDMLRRAAQDSPPSLVARPCRCAHVWEFEPAHCTACGLDLRP